MLFSFFQSVDWTLSASIAQVGVIDARKVMVVFVTSLPACVPMAAYLVLMEPIVEKVI